MLRAQCLYVGYDMLRSRVHKPLCTVLDRVGSVHVRLEASGAGSLGHMNLFWGVREMHTLAEQLSHCDHTASAHSVRACPHIRDLLRTPQGFN